MTSKRQLGRAGRLLLFGAKGVIVAVAAWYAIYIFVGDGVPNLGYLNAAGFHWGLASILCGLFILVSRRWLWGGTGTVLGSAVLSIGIGTDIGILDARRTDGGSSLRVVSASLRTANPYMRAAASTLLATKGDVFAVQEARYPQLLLAEIERQSGRNWYGAANEHTVVISRLPVHVEARPHEMLKVRLHGPAGRSLSLWTMRAPKDYSQPVRLRRYFNNLAEQIRNERPDIVAGDFNSTPWNDGYRLVAKKLVDSFRRAGSGPGFTFPTRGRRMGALFPLVRIDHIFVGPRAMAMESFVGTASPGSDHFPVISDVTFRQPL